jgi:YhfZ-like protein/helix-turn-helix protein
MTQIDPTPRPKNLEVLRQLAADLLCRPVGSRLPTSREYQARFSAGSGTVSKCIRTLEEIGAVAVVPHGHQGTFVTGRDVGRLWTLSEQGPVSGLLTPTLPSQTELLTEDLRERFKALGVPFHVMLRRGADWRVSRVLAGEADLAVISGSAFARASARAGLRAWPLAPFTYYGAESLMVIQRPGLRSARTLRRVGIASDTQDHAELARAEFGDAVEYVPLEYDALVRAVAERGVDAAVWHRVPLAIPFELVGVTTRPLQRPAAIELAATGSHAVVVARADAAELGALLDDAGLGAIAPREASLAA